MKRFSYLIAFAVSSAADYFDSNNLTSTYSQEYYIRDDDYNTSISYKTGTHVANCGGEFTDIDAFLYPSNQLETGEEAYLYTKYNAPFEVENGYVLTTLNFNGVPYPEFNTSLCSNGESGFTKFLRSPLKYLHYRTYEKILSEGCPILEGNHAINSSFIVPNDVGTLKSKISWFSDSGSLLICIKILAIIVAPNHRR
jgi:hypothetical protein